MTIKEYRQKSKAGGFDTFGMSNAEVFLEPKSFQAVGKTLGWNEEDPEIERICVLKGNCHIKKMHAMIDALAEGKSVEDYLATLTEK